MTIRKTIQWMLIIVLLGTGTAGGFVYWMWSQSDEMLRTAVLEKFAELMPNCKIDISRARFDWRRRIRLYDLTLQTAGGSRPIAAVPEIVMTVDRQELIENDRVIVQKVTLLDPEIDLVRDHRGEWNWQKLLPLRRFDMSCPEWAFARGIVRIQWMGADGTSPARMTFEHSDGQLIPSGKRAYVVKAEARFKQTGRLVIDGRWDIDSNSWNMAGKVNNVRADRELTGFVAASSPQLQAQLARLESYVNPAASEARPGAALPAANVHSNFGLDATLAVEFNVARSGLNEKPSFRAVIELDQGQLDNPLLPFTLRDLSGRFEWEDDRLRIHELTANNGVTQIRVDGEVVRHDSLTPMRLGLNVSNLVLDRRLYGRLPDSWKRIHDRFLPAGQIDVKAALIYDGLGRWRTENLVAEAKGCRCVAHSRKLPYPLSQVTGTIRQQGQTNVFKLDFQALAGRREVTLTGTVIDPGPAAEASYKARVEQFPLDDAFLSACPLAMRKTIVALQLEGLVDAVYRIERPPGLNQEYQTELHARVTNGSLEYERFPYRLSRLTGIVNYSSKPQQWRFVELQARHGDAVLEGGGWFTKSQGLHLKIDARGAQLDQQLKRALSNQLQTQWNDIAPAGQIDLEAAIDWMPGQKPFIRLPKVELVHGSFQLKAFPYPIDQVRARFAYNGSDVKIHSLKGFHGATAVFVDDGEVILPRSNDQLGQWRVRLNKLRVDDLQPDRLFRRALPPALQTAFEQLNPRGKVSLSGAIEFAGTARPQDPVRSAWNLQTVLSGTTISAGVELENVFGKVVIRGQSVGERIRTEDSSIDLDSIEIWDHQFTNVRGPFEVDDRKLVLGSSEAFQQQRNRGAAPAIPSSKRITANAIGGIFTLDVEAILLENTLYDIKVAMVDGRLEEYARRYMPRMGSKTLRGVMYGWIELHGEGAQREQLFGSGQLLIQPAALYELPVIVQIFKAFSFVPPDKTAFNYALANFDVSHAQFRFKLIDLIGDAISLRGQGTVGFDGRLRLDFYSMLARRQLEIPIFNVVVGEATKGWAGVEVRGNVRAPIATVKAVPQLDNALRQFLSAFDPRSPGNVGSLLMAPFALPPPQPQQRATPQPATGGRPRAARQ